MLVKITLDWLAERDACAAARKAFAGRFPDGATYVEVQAALHAENRADWSRWLVDALYRGLLDSPADVTTQNVDAHVGMARQIIAAAPPAVIETSTPDAAQIGSSGNYARIGSSGNYAQIVATGENATIACAGIGARVKAGQSGCFALAWHDGTRNRIVVGYVGEDGIKADTWYRVEDGKLVEAA